jgi:small subunit ribosomal protein S1
LIKEVNTEDKRLLLSYKDAGNDPWTMVGQKFPEGTVHKVKLVRREPYGLFFQLEEGIVGLLPKSKANENPEFPFEKIKLGEEAMIQISEIKWEERKIGLIVPKDPDAEAWRGFSGTNASGFSTGSFGSLGDQFKTLVKKN